MKTPQNLSNGQGTFEPLNLALVHLTDLGKVPWWAHLNRVVAGPIAPRPSKQKQAVYANQLKRKFQTYQLTMMNNKTPLWQRR